MNNTAVVSLINKYKAYIEISSLEEISARSADEKWEEGYAAGQRVASAEIVGDLRKLMVENSKTHKQPESGVV
jgi:hypothetical protein